MNTTTIGGNLVRGGLGLMAVGILMYHGMKAMKTNWWVSWLHVVVVAPLLAYMAWRGSKLTKEEGNLVLLVGLGAITFHAWRLYEKLSNK